MHGLDLNGSSANFTPVPRRPRAWWRFAPAGGCVAEADIGQCLELSATAGTAEKKARACSTVISRDIEDGLALVTDLECFAVVALAVANIAQGTYMSGRNASRP